MNVIHLYVVKNARVQLAKTAQIINATLQQKRVRLMLHNIRKRILLGPTAMQSVTRLVRKRERL